MWWPKPNVSLYIHRGCHRSPRTCHSYDGSPRKLAIFSLSPVRRYNFLSEKTLISHCREPGAARVFPFSNVWPGTNTVEKCLNQCAAFGYPAAGLEFGEECWCGDVTNEADNGGVTAPEQDCSFPCAGDPLHLCGGAERLTLYHWNGNLNTWHTPAITGHYEVPILVSSF